MKKLLVVMALLVSVASFAQKSTLHKKVATVTDIISDRAILSAGKYDSYNVSAKNLEVGSEYVFYLAILDNSNTPKAEVKGAIKTKGQAQRDMDRTRKTLEKNYTIID
ncbi:hypothetical protein [Formosa sp. S-31]|uniref:hypothetical protein n=1 Tax=Formosa sp. S-31 TaxID=2790949 RepID=UPI003EB7EA0F